MLTSIFLLTVLVPYLLIIFLWFAGAVLRWSPGWPASILFWIIIISLSCFSLYIWIKRKWIFLIVSVLNFLILGLLALSLISGGIKEHRIYNYSTCGWWSWCTAENIASFLEKEWIAEGYSVIKPIDEDILISMEGSFSNPVWGKNRLTIGSNTGTTHEFNFSILNKVGNISADKTYIAFEYWSDRIYLTSKGIMHVYNMWTWSSCDCWYRVFYARVPE